jgi:hypothetical protein
MEEIVRQVGHLPEEYEYILLVRFEVQYLQPGRLSFNPFWKTNVTFLNFYLYLTCPSIFLFTRQK